ncbi:PucR family transcriptional regulator [Dehalobacter sp. TBBPA1]|uniref:PucR family transcriptional regulator n=1 Tax=Dehalobacter sp. TBBPA1 TaxID=3235037 RepID=UPI0034A554FE
MKINIFILYDELKRYHPQIIADDEFPLNLCGVRRLPLDQKNITTDYLYLLFPEEIPSLDVNPKKLNIVVLGKIDKSTILAYGYQAIIIDGNNNSELVFQQIQDIFDKYNCWGETMMEYILQRKSLQIILDKGAEPLSNPIALFDISFKFIGQGGVLNSKTIEGSIWKTAFTKGYAPVDIFPDTYRNMFYEKLEGSDSSFLIRPPKEFQDNCWLLGPVFSQNHLNGFLGATDINCDFTKGECSIVTYFAKMMGIYFENIVETTIPDRDIPYFIDRILSGYSVEEGIVEYYLKKQGWKMNDTFKLFYVSGQDLSKSHQELYFIMFRLKVIFKNCILFRYENGIVVIVKTKENKLVYEGEGEADFKEFEKLLSEMNVNAGISMEFYDFMSIKYAYKQSKAALKEGAPFSHKRYCFFEECYSKHIISSLNESTGLKSLCNQQILKISAYDKKNGDMLLTTLRSYLLSGCNISQTAKNLYIHRNTLMYRINRIEDILETDLREINEEQFLILYITCLILTNKN